MELNIKKNDSMTKSIFLLKPDHLEYVIEEDASLTLYIFSYGWDGTSTVHIQLIGERSKAVIRMVVLVRNQEHMHIDTSQVHVAQHSSSDLSVVSGVSDNGFFDYTGTIIVKKSAHGTDAYQRSDTVLLSPNATSSASPILEIQTNDIRCTHGVTTQPLDKESIWYLESRGLSEIDAKHLLTEGFLFKSLPPDSDILGQSLRKKIWKILPNYV